MSTQNKNCSGNSNQNNRGFNLPFIVLILFILMAIITGGRFI